MNLVPFYYNDTLHYLCIFYKLYICRRKNPPLTYKISTSSGQWVVKFNPLRQRDPWYDVKKEYSILQGLYPVLPVPKPVYASTNSDEWMVGTAFIVMEFVKVCLSEVHTHALLIIIV